MIKEFIDGGSLTNDGKQVVEYCCKIISCDHVWLVGGVRKKLS